LRIRIYVHLVFVTKYRRKVFDRDPLQRLRAIFEKVCRDFQAELVEMNGEAEHAHLLIHYPPKHPVSSPANLKGVPVAYSVSNDRIWRNAIAKKKTRSNGPYISGLKIRGFTARGVRQPGIELHGRSLCCSREPAE
jgi:putative transposase